MDVLQPRGLEEALGMKAAHPEAVALMGGTDLMVELNFGRLRPASVLDLSRLEELRAYRREDGHAFLGAGMTYTWIINHLPEFIPLRQASRSIGSPQIRNRGTVGGNLGTASPAGDALPVVAAYEAEVVLSSAQAGTRMLPWHAFLLGPKRSAIRPEELILGIRWKPASGPGSFSKIGTRNAMVIAIASLCLVVDEDARQVRVALGSVGPTVVRAREAEGFLAQTLPWDEPQAPVSTHATEEFAERVAAAAQPIDDVRGTAAYRRHACRILARRALTWALEERRARPWW